MNLAPNPITNITTVYIVLEVLIAVLAIVGNLLVFWVVALSSNLQSITNYFLVSLAVADVSVGLLGIPCSISVNLGFCGHFTGCLFLTCFMIMLRQSSVFSLLAIAIDRYISIKAPLRYVSLVTGWRAACMIATCWLLAAIVAFTPMVGWNAYSINATNTSCATGLYLCKFETLMAREYLVFFNFFGCLLVELFAMLIIYTNIFLVARNQLLQMELQQIYHHFQIDKSPSLRSRLQREVHAAKSLFISIGLFAICWLPLHLYNSFILLKPGLLETLPLWVRLFSINLSHANSALNPLIYAFRLREFRKTFQRLIHRHILNQPPCLDMNSSSVRDPRNNRAECYTLAEIKKTPKEHKGAHHKNNECCFDMQPESTSAEQYSNLNSNEFLPDVVMTTTINPDPPTTETV